MFHTGKKIRVAAVVLLLLAASTLASAEDKERILRQLDQAARNFHSAAATFQFDTVETDPVFDKDVQKGVVYYQRSGSNFQMAAHIREHNGRPTDKTYSYSNGLFKLFEGGNVNQVTVFTKFSKYESYLLLGFGASGRELEEKWEIKALGPEVLDGVKTQKLELVAKDPSVRRNIPKVTLWIDPERDVSLKQVFDEGPSNYRVSVYFDIKVNQPLPAGAFSFKTDAHTHTVTK